MKKVLLLFLAVAGLTFTACEKDEIDALNTQMIEGDAYLQYQIDNLVADLEEFKNYVTDVVTSIYNTIEENKLASEAFKNPLGALGLILLTAFVRASICSGVVPQQPPKKLTPLKSVNSNCFSVNSSGPIG